MELTYNRVDLAASELFHHSRKTSPGLAFVPYDTVERKAGEDWYVPHGAISFTEPPDWRISKRDSRVFVPLVPYLLPCQPDLALGFMLQLACGCFGSLDRRVERLHIATGYPVNDVFDEAQQERLWQYYVGFAVLLRKQ